MICHSCGLYEDCITNCLKGEGRHDAPIMVLGDIPDYKADQVGSPFMGRASQYLRTTLAEKGINANDCYFTYLVKCRPYDGAEPQKDEIATCMEYFNKEYERIKPKFILTFGNITLKALTGKSGIMKYRGSEIPYKDSIIIPTMSPAAVERNPRNLPLFNSDIELLADRYFGKPPLRNTDIQMHYVMNKDDLKCLLAELRHTEFFCYDLETEGFDYWLPDKDVLCMSIATSPTVVWGIPFVHPQSPWRNKTHDVMKLLKPFFELKSVGGQNGKFDDKWLKYKYGIYVNYDEDLMFASFCDDENTPNGLKHIAKTYFHSGDYDRGIQFSKSFPLWKLLKYNCYDSIYTFMGIEKFVGKLKKDPRMYNIYRNLLIRGSRMFEDIEIFGVYIMPERLNQSKIECQAHIDQCLRELDEAIPQAYKDTYLIKVKKGVKQEFNWNSPKQVANLFYIADEGLKLPILKYTDTGNPSTDENTMLSLREEVDNTVLEKLLEYRHWAKFMSTYIISWGEKRDKNSRLHTNFKLTGTVTGRLSADDGIHQVPRDQFIRQLIGAPPGWTFVEADQSQMELRLVAHESQDPIMRNTYLTGGDLHLGTASEVTGKRPEDITKEERKKAKAVNFGFVYGMGAKKFKIYAHDNYGVTVTIEEALKTRRKYFNRYKLLTPWHERRKREARELGYVVYGDGRKRHLPDVYSANDGVRAEAERQAINSPIQGVGSDIVLFAAIRLYENYVKDNWDEIRMTMTVHDAIGFEIRNDVVNKWLPIIKQEMEDIVTLKETFNLQLSVPLVVEIEVGQDWGHKKVWEPGTVLEVPVIA